MNQEDCWEWPSVRSSDGRARATLDGRDVYPYRVTAAMWGKTPGRRSNHRLEEDDVVDHKCGNPACVNPRHLQVTTAAQHTRIEQRRGKVKSGDANVGMAAKTHCPRGHPYAGDNLYVAPNGDRYCRLCRRQNQRRSRGNP